MRTSSQETVQSWIHDVWRRCNLRSSIASPSTRDGVQLDHLEPRLCFSANPLGMDTLAAAFDASTMERLDPLTPEDVAEHSEHESGDVFRDQQFNATELIFIDGGVEDHETLAHGLASQFGDAAQIYVLDTSTDGVAQMTRQLQSHSDISAIHILTHGNQGNVRLGDVTLNSDTLAGYAADLSSWAGPLSSDADILFYGCDFAGSDDGQTLVNAIATLTEADVAASHDKTGDARLGGDWNLEYETGTLQALGITQSAVGGWSHLLELSPSGEQLINSDAPQHSIVATSQATSETGHFSESAVAVSSNGDHAIVWTSQGTTGSDVFVRVLDKDGNEIRAQQIVNDEFTNGNQHSASVAMDAAGNFVVVWVTDQDNDGSANNVYARLYNSDGSAKAPAFRVYDNAIASAGDQFRPDVTMNDAGMFAVVWDGAGFGETFGIAANIFDATGASQSGVFDVNDPFGFSGIQSSPTIGMDGIGTVSIAWNDDLTLSGASFSADGTPIANLSIPGIPFTDQEFRNPTIDVREDGMIALAYEWRIQLPFSPWSDWDIDVQVLNPAFQDNTFDGFAVGPENGGSDEGNATVSFNEDGSIFLTWFGQGTGDADGVFARRLSFQSNGGTGWTAVGDGPDLLVNQTTAGSQQFASVAAVDHDNFVVVWSGNGVGDADGVYARRFGTGSTNAIYMTTGGDVTGSATPGLDSWTSGAVWQFGGPDASYEPTGTPDSTTAGTFAGLLNFDGFLQDGSGNVTAFHLVNRDIEIGITTKMQLEAGDMLFAFKDNETFVGGLAVNDGDLVVFRPDYQGDYSSGVVSLVLTGLDDAKFDNVSEIRGISLVEHDTNVGDATLLAGDFLFTRNGAQHDNDIYVLRTTAVGAGTTDGSVEKLIEGDDIGISRQIVGIDLIEQSGVLGDTVLPTGGLILTVHATESFNGVDSDNANNFSAEKQDIILLNMQETTLVAGVAAGEASLLFDADDVGLTHNSANPNGLALAGLLSVTPPTVNSDGISITEDSGSRTIDVLANDLDVDGAVVAFDVTSTQGDVTLNPDNTFTYAANGQFEDLAVGVTTTDTFTYTVTTAHGASTGTVTITVTGVNDNPTGGGFGATYNEDQLAFVAPLLNFANDVDGDTLNVDPASIVQTSATTLGVSISGNEIEVNPRAHDYLAIGESVVESYDYDIVDGNGGRTTVTAEVTFTGVNDRPTSSDLTVTTNEDTAYQFILSDFTSVFSDVDDSDQLEEIFFETLPASGQLIHATLGTLTAPVTISAADIAAGELSFQPVDDEFSPAPGDAYVDFLFKVSDGTALQAGSSTLSIVVDSVNDAPTATDNGFFAFTNTTTTLDVLSNDSDDDGLDPSSITISPLPVGTSVIINPDGTLDFTSSLSGSIQFSYSVLDVSGTTSNTATVTVEVGNTQAVDLWLSTANDVTSSGVTGLDSWNRGETIQFGGAGVTYDPAGATTDGEFASVFSLSQFGASANLTALHYMTQSFTVGSGGDSFTFRDGDVLFAVDQASTLSSTNTEDIEVGDFALFRPDAIGDYSSGRFFEVYDSDSSYTIAAATIVEHSLVFGGFQLDPGDLIFTKAGDSSVYLFEPTTVGSPGGGGAGTTGTTTTIMTGVGGVTVDGLELIERPTSLGDAFLNAGTMLMSVDGAMTAGGAMGTVSVESQDIFAFESTPSGNKATLLFDGTDAGLSTAAENVDAIALNFGVTAMQSINGLVVEDVNGDGNLADQVGASGATVRLYRDNGDGIADDSDTFVTLTTTDSSGAYSFSNLRQGEYFVTVDSKTITPDAGFNGAANNSDVWAEQTFGSAGSLYVNGSGSVVQRSGTLFGGKEFGVSDSADSLETSQHVVAVELTGGTTVGEARFGFSFNVVTNTLGGDNQDDSVGVNHQTVQGSLRQFIDNANHIAGGNTMRFVPGAATEVGSNYNFLRGTGPNASGIDGSAWWQVAVSTALPSITDAGTVIDGTAYNALDGTSLLNTNSNHIGWTGPDGIADSGDEFVGVGPDGIANTGDESLLSGLAGVELEIADTGGVLTGIDVQASNTTITRLAVHSFGGDPSLSPPTGSNIQIGTDGGPELNNVQVIDNAIGSAPDRFRNPGSDSNSGSNIIIVHADHGTIEGNLIGFANSWGIALFGGADGWTIDSNEIRANALTRIVSDGIDILAGSEGTIIRHNRIVGNRGGGIDSYASGGNNFIAFNTISGNGKGGSETAGVRLFGAGSEVVFNKISGNEGAGVLVVGEIDTGSGPIANSSSQHNLISKNRFNNNGSIAIDLGAATNDQTQANQGDGISLNDGIEINTSGNDGFDFAVVTHAHLTNGTLTIEGTAAPNSHVELYLASAGTGDSLSGASYGEGSEYLATVSTNSSGQFSISLSNPSVSGSSKITTLTIDQSNNNTSEFSESVQVFELTAVDDVLTVSEGGSLNSTVADNDILPTLGSVTYTLMTATVNGSISLGFDGKFEYIHDGSETTSDEFQYQITDDQGNFSTATASITVLPENDVPVAGDDNITLDEDQTFDGTVAVNDIDMDGDSLTYALEKAPNNGNVILNPDGTFTYEPFTNFAGADAFTYLVSDGNGGEATATVHVTVNPVNDAPVAIDDVTEIDEDGQLDANVSDNDSDVDSPSLFYSLQTSTTHGTLSFQNNGTYTYTPDADFFGIDQFEYEVFDGLERSTATVTITVRPVNDVPVANDDIFIADEDTMINGTVSLNDSDPDDATLTFRLVTGTTRGSLSLSRDGTFEYQPNTDFNGTDTFLYEVEDASGATAMATVNISILAVNDAPDATADLFDMLENETLMQSVAMNDGDVDDTDLTYMLTSPPANGAISFNQDGSFSYTPDTEFVGTSTFEYAVSDPSGATSFATATINVANVNRGPIAADDSFATQEDIELNGSVGINDSDPDDDLIVYSLVSGPASGHVQLNQNGSFKFTPGANQHGTFSFVYRATDTGGLEDTAEVTINVASVNDAPIASDDEFTASLSAPVTIDASELLANDMDVENDVISVEFLNSPDNGTVSKTDDGSITYIPNSNFVGVDTFTYVVTDGNATSAPASVSITILGAPPVATTTRTETAVTETEVGDGADGGDSAGSGSTATAAPTIGALLAQTIGTDTDNEEGTVVGLLNDVTNSNDGTDLESFVTEITTAADSLDASPQLASFSFSSATASGGLLSTRPTTNPMLKPVELADIGTLDYSQYLLEGESYVAIMEGMDEFRETLKSNLALPELAVEGFVAATSSFSVGMALWLLRGGYIVASVISALPAWQTFDPIPILAYATKEEGESIESLMEG